MATEKESRAIIGTIIVSAPSRTYRHILSESAVRLMRGAILKSLSLVQSNCARCG
jgi:hypothetical protein